MNRVECTPIDLTLISEVEILFPINSQIKKNQFKKWWKWKHQNILNPFYIRKKRNIPQVIARKKLIDKLDISILLKPNKATY